MGLFSSYGHSPVPQMRLLMLNEEQQRAINAIMFGDNYLLIAAEENGMAFVDMNIDEGLLFDGLEFLCEKNPELIDKMTNLVIDLHNKKK